MATGAGSAAWTEPLLAITMHLKGGLAYLCGACWALPQLLDAGGIGGSRSLSMSLLLKAGALHARLGVVCSHHLYNI